MSRYFNTTSPLQAHPFIFPCVREQNLLITHLLPKNTPLNQNFPFISFALLAKIKYSFYNP